MHSNDRTLKVPTTSTHFRLFAYRQMLPRPAPLSQYPLADELLLAWPSIIPPLHDCPKWLSHITDSSFDCVCE